MLLTITVSTCHSVLIPATVFSTILFMSELNAIKGEQPCAQTLRMSCRFTRDCPTALHSQVSNLMVAYPFDLAHAIPFPHTSLAFSLLPPLCQ